MLRTVPAPGPSEQGSASTPAIGDRAQTTPDKVRTASPHPVPGRPTSKFQHLYRRLLRPLLRLTLFVAIGLFIGNLIEALQWTHHLGRITRPFLRWGHLSDHSAVAFMAAFFSGVTANTMLVNAYQDGSLSRRELFFANLVNTLPSYFLHLPTTFFILLPLVRTAGLFYLLVTFSAALIRTLVVLMISRLALPKPAASENLPQPVEPSRSLGRKTWEKFHRRLRRILVWTVPIYTLFFFINEMGFFKFMQQALASHLSIHVLPLGAVSVIAFQVMTEFTAGAAAAGALLDAGTLTIKQTVLALLFGNVISSPVRALRHQLPYYMGIFTPRLGMPLLVVSQLVRLSSIIVAMLLFYGLFPA